MIVVPAIDLLDGKAVRLHQGRYDQVTVYDADPPARARGWRGVAERLHVVDLEGARSGRAVQAEAVRAIVAAFGPGVQVGGGVRSLDAAESYLALGADRVVLGTAAVKDRALVESLARAHPGRVVVALDARNGRVALEGWTEASDLLAVDLARDLSALPLGGILYTDIARDGTRAGPNVAATAELARACPGTAVLASGGVGSLEDVRALAQAGGIAGAIVGRALYEGSFRLEEALATAAAAAPART